MGRPREFDTEQALERAMEVFWRKGYDGATLPDLCEAMGINKPSLYSAFGNKEALFHQVLDRYEACEAAPMRDALAAPTARAAVEALLRGAVQLQTDPANPGGCLLVHGALAGGENTACIRQEVAERRLAAECALRKRLTRAVEEGELPPATDAMALARFYATIIRGMAVQAAAGATPEELDPVVDMALAAWPAGQ